METKHKTNIFESSILFTRYMLLPLYLGLMVCMAFYNFAFFQELLHLGGNLFHEENLKEFLLISVLSLLDMAMIANLIVMITIGSYSIFVKELNIDNIPFAPRFLKNMTSGLLKVKMGSSLVSVSSIHLLSVFMRTESVSWEDFSKKVIIHFAFIISAYFFAKMECMLHPAHESVSPVSH